MQFSHILASRLAICMKWIFLLIFRSKNRRRPKQTMSIILLFSLRFLKEEKNLISFELRRFVHHSESIETFRLHRFNLIELLEHVKIHNIRNLGKVERNGELKHSINALHFWRIWKSHLLLVLVSNQSKYFKKVRQWKIHLP